MIVSLIGAKGSGKDTVATLFHEELNRRKPLFYIKHLSFAEPLKDILWNLYGNKILVKSRLWGNDRSKNIPIQDLPITEQSKALFPSLENAEYWTGRKLMQLFGTEVFRSIYENVWVDRAMDSIRDSIFSNGGGYQCVVFTDARFPSEDTAMYQLAYEFGCPYITIRIDRPSIDTSDSHESEKGYIDMKADGVIDNSAGLKELRQEVNRIIDDILRLRSADSVTA